MDQASSDDVTRLLAAAGRGDPAASAELLPLVYEELRKLASARMGRLPPGQTLQPTALVHEAYLRLVGDAELQWDSRGHFFAAAAQAMRNILVERARKHGRVRHGGGRQRVEFKEPSDDPGAAPLDLLALDEALTRLAQEDERKSRVVMLRFFAGLTIEETALAMESSSATVKREWNYAKAWLFDAMNSMPDDSKFSV